MKRAGPPTCSGSASSPSNVTRGWSLPSSTEGKDNRREEMTVVVFLYRTNLPVSVETRPWCLWANGLPKPPEKLQLLLLTEHRLASGQTLKLKDEFGLGTFKLVFDLLSHPIEPSGDFLLISA